MQPSCCSVSPPAWLCCRAGTYNPAKLFGVTTLDVARSRAFIGQILEVDPAKVDIPVIGGHAGEGSWCRCPCAGYLSLLVLPSMQVRGSWCHCPCAVYSLLVLPKRIPAVLRTGGCAGCSSLVATMC